MPAPLASRTPLLRFSKVLGLLLLVEVALIALGWVFHLPLLVQVSPRFAPAQPSTALGLLLAALALLLLGAGHRRLARGLGGALSLFGLLILAEYVFPIAPDVDALLRFPPFTTGPLQPGRMGPNTALAFLAFGLAMLVEARGSLAVTFGSAVWVLGAVALFGYASHVEPAFGWGQRTDMALLAAIGFVLLGLGVVATVVARIPESQVLRTTALTATITVALTATLFWDALNRQQRSELHRSVGVTGARMEIVVREVLGSQLARVERVLNRALRTGGMASAEGLAPALHDDPIIYAVAWFEPGREQAIVVPDGRPVPAVDPAGIVPLPGLGLGLSPVLAGNQRRFLAASFPDLLSGGAPLLVFLEPDALFRDALASFEPGYDVGLRQTDGSPVFETVDTAPWAGKWSQLGTIHLGDGYDWEYAVRPRRDTVASYLPPLPWILLGAGFLLAVVVGLSSALLVQTSLRAREADRLNAELTASREKSRALARDLEELVRKRTAALGQSNKELREFARFLSHELRQPLGSLSLWADLFSSTHRAGLDDDGRRCIDEITHCVKAIDQLIHSHLVMSSVIDQSVPDDLVDLNDMLRNVLTALEDLGEMGATVEVGELPVTRGDFLQIEQAFRNVLENAVKYRDPVRPLRIQVRTATIDGELVTVEVVDNGTGFDPEHNQNIFLPHYRVHEDGEGTGLGLAIAKKILERHGGTIAAEGRPGVGTTIRVQLPLAGQRPPLLEDPLQEAGP